MTCFVFDEGWLVRRLTRKQAWKEGWRAHLKEHGAQRDGEEPRFYPHIWEQEVASDTHFQSRQSLLLYKSCCQNPVSILRAFGKSFMSLDFEYTFLSNTAMMHDNDDYEKDMNNSKVTQKQMAV